MIILTNKADVQDQGLEVLEVAVNPEEDLKVQAIAEAILVQDQRSKRKKIKDMIANCIGILGAQESIANLQEGRPILRETIHLDLLHMVRRIK